MNSIDTHGMFMATHTERYNPRDITNRFNGFQSRTIQNLENGFVLFREIMFMRG